MDDDDDFQEDDTSQTESDDVFGYQQNVTMYNNIEQPTTTIQKLTQAMRQDT